MGEKKKMRSPSVDDMIAAFLITYAFAAFSFEKNMPESIMKIYNAVVFAVFAAAWLWFSYKSGRRRGRKFPIFTVMFWLLPQVVIYLADSGPEVFRMSIIMYVLSEFLMMLTNVPPQILGNAVGITVPASVIVILLLCGASYMSGMLVCTYKEGNYTK